MSMLRDLVRLWTEPDFPYKPGSDPMPYLIHTMFWVGVWMPIGAVAFVIAKFLLRDAATIIVNGQEVTAVDFSSYGGALPLTVGLVGIVVAYGIWAERSYPRYLVMIVLIGAAVWANIRMIQTQHVSWEPVAAAIGALGAVKYLMRNPDVVDYYSRRSAKRTTGQPTGQHTDKTPRRTFHTPDSAPNSVSRLQD